MNAPSDIAKDGLSPASSERNTRAVRREEATDALVLALDGLDDADIAMLPVTVVTHAAKLANAQVPLGQSVRCMRSTRHESQFRHGLCSLSVGTTSGLGCLSTVNTLRKAELLSGDLGLEFPGSLLDLCFQDGGTPPATLSPSVWDGLSTTVKALPDMASDEVMQSERLVFFEVDAGDILLTPVPSLKLVHEMNRRLGEREAARALADAAPRDDKASSRPARRIRRGTWPVGGAKPQNAGYVVNSSRYRNTRYGGTPFLVVPYPVDKRTPLQKMLARIGALQSYSRTVWLPPQLLLAFGHRAAISIDLATHRDAERESAIALARVWVSQRNDLQPTILSRPEFGDRDPWKSMPPDVLAWLDPRLGTYDRTALAHRFGQDIKTRIESLMTVRARRSAEQRGKPLDTVPSFIVPPRSFKALVEALLETLV